MAKRGGGAAKGGNRPVVGGVKIGKAGGNVPKKGGGVQKGNKKPAMTLKQKLAAARGGNAAPKGNNGLQRAAQAAQAGKPKPTGSGRHTLLLKQETPAASSKTWADYGSVNEAVDGFISSYEAKLRNLNPGLKTLTYSVADLQQFVDSMHDVSLMVSDAATKQYAPKGKAFLKQMLMSRLKSAVA